MGSQSFGIDQSQLDHYAENIKEAVASGIELAIVIGGGNIYRGLQAEKSGIDRVQGDYMGMLATVINGLALQNVLEKHGIYTRLVSAIKMEQICEPYIRRKAIRHMEKGRVVIFSAGTGNPFFTTDTAASLRAIEIDADVILKGTKVDGVYTKDPVMYSDAKRYDNISYSQVLSDNLKIMDASAISLARDNNIPIIVFSINKKNALSSVINGKGVSSLISNMSEE